MPDSAYSESNPWRSKSMAVPPNMAAKENERLKYHGIKCASYDERSGELVATSRKAAANAQRIRGMQNNDAGYSDFGGS